MDDIAQIIARDEQRMTDFERRVDELKNDMSSFRDGVNSEIKELKNDNKAIFDIVSSIKVIAEKISNIEEKVDATNSKVNKIENRIVEVEKKPDEQIAKNWNAVKVAIFSAACTFLVTGVIGAVIVFIK